MYRSPKNATGAKHAKDSFKWVYASAPSGQLSYGRRVAGMKSGAAVIDMSQKHHFMAQAYYGRAENPE